MKPTVYAPCVEYDLEQESLRLEHRIDGQLWAVKGRIRKPRRLRTALLPVVRPSAFCLIAG